MKKDAFFKMMAESGMALAYDDLRLKTGYSETNPADAILTSRFSRNVPLNVPIVSAAMDTVTEVFMAIAMAKNGGLGIIHRALAFEAQASQVKRVKLHLNGCIENPICVNINDTISEIEERRHRNGFSFNSFPVLDNEGKVVGLITQNDFDLANDNALPAGKMMTPFADLVTAKSDTTLKQAYDLLRQARKKVLPLLNESGGIAGMYALSDVKRLLEGSSTLFNVDQDGHLRVGAAIGANEHELERATALIEAGCDVLVVDTAHGNSKNVYTIIKKLKTQYPQVDIVAGNVSEGDSAKHLAMAGVDGVKVGQGPGSICTTRIVAGIGCPQATAVYECAKALRGTGVPTCADGGIKNSGDVPIALGLGADSVMLGRVLAGTDEAPGEIRDTPQGRVKVYRGMGSLPALKASRASRERYRQNDDITKLVPEGIESVVPYDGKVAYVLVKYVGGLRSGMGYVGADTIAELQEKANFWRISTAGLTESHPHDVIITDSSAK